MAKTIKKIPNHTFKEEFEMSFTINADKIAKKQPNIAKITAGKMLINLFFTWIKITKIAIITNEKTLKNWACFWTTPKKILSNGIKIVPPPSPIPPAIPPKTPTKI